MSCLYAILEKAYPRGMTEVQQTALNAIRAGIVVRNVKVAEQVREDRGNVFVNFGPGWPTVRIGRAAGIDLLEIRTYRMSSLEAAIHGDELYARQQMRDRSRPNRAIKYKTGKALLFGSSSAPFSLMQKLENLPLTPDRRVVDQSGKHQSVRAGELSRPKVSGDMSSLDRLVRHIESTIDLVKAAKGPSSYWASLPLCIIDSVWSIQADYERQVCPLIKKFCQSHSPCWEGETSRKPITDIGPTVREFVDVIQRRLETGYTYETLFGNRQRTSSRSGILKAKAVQLFANALLASGINKFSDLKDCNKLKQAEKRVKEIPGQGSGITFTYFLMLSGEDEFVKSDTHIRRFVSDALSIDWSRLVSTTIAEGLIRESAMKFAKAYLGVTPASLDSAIWAYQHTRIKPSQSFS